MKFVNCPEGELSYGHAASVKKMIPMPSSLRTVKGENPISAPRVGDSVPLVTVDLD